MNFRIAPALTLSFRKNKNIILIARLLRILWRINLLEIIFLHWNIQFCVSILKLCLKFHFWYKFLKLEFHIGAIGSYYLLFWILVLSYHVGLNGSFGCPLIFLDIFWRGYWFYLQQFFILYLDIQIFIKRRVMSPQISISGENLNKNLKHMTRGSCYSQPICCLSAWFPFFLFRMFGKFLFLVSI